MNKTTFLAHQFRNCLGAIPSEQTVKEALRSMSCRVIYFDTGGEEDRLINLLGLTDYAHQTNAFACEWCDHRFIFVRGTLPQAQRVHLLLHEAGHILQGHTAQPGAHKKNDLHERQAELFRKRVEHPGVLWQAGHALDQIRFSLTTVLLLLTLFLATLCLTSARTAKTHATPPPSIEQCAHLALPSI